MMPFPATLFIQEIDGTLYVNRSAEGAGGHRQGTVRVGVDELVKQVNIRRTSTVQVEDIPPSEKAAEGPQN